MADTFEILNGASVSWGTDDDNTLGTILDSTVEESAQFEKVENNQGAVVGLVVYDTETVVTLEVLAGASATRPSMGDTLTLGSVLAYVLKASEKCSSKGMKKFSVTANKWANCAPTA